MRRELLDFLKMHDVKFKENQSLQAISPIKIGGEAEVVVYPDSEDKMVSLVGFLDQLKIKHKIIGRMSNLLPSDEKFKGVVVRTDLLRRCDVSDRTFTAYCGASLPYVSKILCESGLGGFEGLSGIPGSIAGAIVGNAGAFGYEIADRLLDVRTYDPHENAIRTFSRFEANFSYRSSVFKKIRQVVLSARFSLRSSDRTTIKKEIERCREIRLRTQPTEPSLGSTFKRPGENIFVARLIDECGLKGYHIGGAEISTKHAGFIVNKGGATAKDYIELSDYVAKCVFDKFGVNLEREIEIMK